MAQDFRDLFVVGLRNAHALENEALSIMSQQVERLRNYPELEQRMRRHIEETEQQAQRLDRILADLSESNSTIKDVAASVMGNMAALGHSFAGDEILKNAFADFAFENYEIAAYRSLITMAERGGFTAAIPLLQATLEQEEGMAEWLEVNLTMITERYMSLEAAGEQANR